MPEKYPTKVTDPDGRIIQGELEAWEESPTDEDCVLLKLSLPDSSFEFQANDYFTAMIEIRKRFEVSGKLMMNYGSSLEVYLSPMSRNMGAGEKAFKLTLGKQGMSSDMVSIFQTGPDISPSKVEDQEKLYQTWLESLKKIGPATL